MPEDRPLHPGGTPAVAAVIPAYNEAKHVRRVLDALRKADRLSEIIVVDDGSCDATAERIREAARLDARIRLIQHSRNLGKGQAVFTGRAATQAPYLLLLDADLFGLRPEHIRNLVDPVIQHKANMTLGLFRGGHLRTDLSHWLTPWLTGQRCLQSDILKNINIKAAKGYGFETALTVAAYQHDVRTQAVPLRGVWHPPSESHRGHGLFWRLRMYGQIARAWDVAGGWAILKARAKRKLPPVLLMFLLALFALQHSSPAEAPRPKAITQLEDTPALSLTDFQRILVVAPHPDDETLGPGGLIQLALAQGSQVHVVVITNGDGQKFAPTVLEDKVHPRPQDYIAIGERRQAESLAALEQLGLADEDAIYLGYPDRGINPMWLEDWNTQCPFRAPYTHLTQDPYPGTFDPQVSYCGNNLLKDMETILKNYRPDLIVLPHPADQHPDHQATSNFVRLALALVHLQAAAYQPQVWGYIVHYASYPQPRGRHFGQVLLPPKRLANTESNWGQLDLSAEQVQVKYRAIENYPSQTRLLGSFLPSFARRDELFVPLAFQYLPSVSYNNLSLLSPGTISRGDPDLASLQLIEDLPVRGNAILAWQVARLSDTVWLNIQTRTNNLSSTRRILHIKLPDGSTQTVDLAPAGPLSTGHSYVAQLDLARLNYPDIICFSAVVEEEGIIVAQTGWHILILKS